MDAAQPLDAGNAKDKRRPFTDAKVDPVVRREILGHAHEDIDDKVYGDPVDLASKKEAIEKLKIPE